MNPKNCLFAISFFFSLVIATKRRKKHEEYLIIKCLSTCKLCNKQLKAMPIVAFFQKNELDKILVMFEQRNPDCGKDSIDQSVNENSTYNYAADTTIDLTTNNNDKSGDNIKKTTDNVNFGENDDISNSMNNHVESIQLSDALKLFINSETFKSKLSSFEMKNFRKFCLENTLFPKGYEKLFKLIFHEICFFKFRNKYFKEEKFPSNIRLEISKFVDLSGILLISPKDKKKSKKTIKYLIEGDSKIFLSKFKRLDMLALYQSNILRKVFSKSSYECDIPSIAYTYTFVRKNVSEFITSIVLKAQEITINSQISADFKNDLLKLVSRETKNVIIHNFKKNILKNIFHSLFYGTTESLKLYLDSLFGLKTYMKTISILVLIVESFFENAKALMKEQEKQAKNLQKLLGIIGETSFFSIIIENSEFDQNTKCVLKAFYDNEIDKKRLNSIENFIQNYYFLPLSLSEKIIILNYLKELNKGLVLDAKYFFRINGTGSPLKYFDHEILNFFITEVGFITFLSRVRCSNLKKIFNDDNKSLIIQEMENEQLLNAQLESFEEGCYDFFISQANEFSKLFKNESIFNKFIQMINANKLNSKIIKTIDSLNFSTQDNLRKNFKHEEFICSNSIKEIYFLYKNKQFDQFLLFQDLILYFENNKHFPKNYSKLYSLNFYNLYSYHQSIRPKYLDSWIQAIFTQEDFILNFETIYFVDNAVFLYKNKYLDEDFFKLKEYLSFHEIQILYRMLNNIDAYLNIVLVKKKDYGDEIILSLKAFRTTVASVIKKISDPAIKLRNIQSNKRKSSSIENAKNKKRRKSKKRNNMSSKA